MTGLKNPIGDPHMSVQFLSYHAEKPGSSSEILIPAMLSGIVGRHPLDLRKTVSFETAVY